MSNHKVIIKTFFGLEKILARELENFGVSEYKISNRAIELECSMEMIYRLNIGLRTALKILMPIKVFKFRNENQLYGEVRKINWNKYFNVEKTILIDAVSFSENMKNSHYLGLKTKDAIADYFRDSFAQRPNVNTKNPDVKISVHINSFDIVTISLDSSGFVLMNRGYRLLRNIAPLSESLAAGLVLFSGWDKKSPLIDPMCGSGTIPIEAAMLALNIPPNLGRKQFGFEHWQRFDQEAFNKVVEEFKAGIKKASDLNFRIYASDIEAENIDIAKQNAERMQVNELIEFRTSAFQQLHIQPQNTPMIIMNPPYGERIKTDDISLLYKEIGATLKHHFSGSTAWIFSGNPKAMNNIGLRPETKIKLFNGAIPASFNKYTLFAGKIEDHKTRKTQK